jgi:hypothetical protein
MARKRLTRVPEITPSPSVLDALARVYDLDRADRAHLFHLAGVALAVSGDPYPVEALAELHPVQLGKLREDRAAGDAVLGLEPNPAHLIGPRGECSCGTVRLPRYSASLHARRMACGSCCGGC